MGPRLTALAVIVVIVRLKARAYRDYPIAYSTVLSPYFDDTHASTLTTHPSVHSSTTFDSLSVIFSKKKALTVCDDANDYIEIRIIASGFSNDSTLLNYQRSVKVL